MNTPSKIDPELETMAHKAGCRVSQINVARRGEEKSYRYFIRRGDDLLLNGQSVSRTELAEFLGAREK